MLDDETLDEPNVYAPLYRCRKSGADPKGTSIAVGEGRVMRRSIKEPIPEIFEAWSFLNEAVDAHLAGERRLAEVCFNKADMRAVWEWLNPAWTRPDLNVVVSNPPDDTQPVSNDVRDSDRNIAPALRTAALLRDGYRCRYCGIPVVRADIRKLAHRLYPSAVPWDQFDVTKEHAGFACLWLQFDHVVPHSHGGRSSLDNVVVSCALCNFGKDKYTLRQLGVTDPRLTPPVSCGWDGLERFRTAEPLKTVGLVGSGTQHDGDMNGASPSGVVDVPPSRDARTFFLPAARFSRGYLYTAPIGGKERWFKIGGEISCIPATRRGVVGYLLSCDAAALRSRGIDSDLFIDTGE